MPEPAAAAAAGSAKAAQARAAAQDAALAVSLKKFSRGKKVATAGIKDKKLKGQLNVSERLARDAAVSAAKTEQWLLPAEAGTLEAEGMERTFRFSQEALASAADATSARKAFDLDLPQLGPYCLDYTPNGRHLLLGGRKGHLALLDWQRPRLTTEIQVRETVRSVRFLHNTNFFAAAQEKYVYIYDKRGLEVHCLREHEHVTAMEFLRRFFLLATVGDAGVLRWQDTSTGAIVAQHRTRLGRCDALCQNEYNGVLAAGHGNGTVTLWSPNMGTPLVSLLAHRGPVRALAVDAGGRHLVTAGADAQLRVWDVRTFRPLHAYYTATPAASVAISQRGMLAVSYGPHVQVWRDALAHKASAPFLNHLLAGGGTVGVSARFCPYDDVLGVGHTRGVCSLLVPGAGEPNFDSYVANPFETKKQRQEGEVHALLDKLQPTMIVLDPDTLGGVVHVPREVQVQRRAEAAAADAAARRGLALKTDSRRKMKGRAKPSARHKRKQLNVIDEKRHAVLEKERLQALLAPGGGKKGGAAAAGVAGASPARDAPSAAAVPLALRRFVGRTKPR